MLSLMEVPVVIFHERFGWTRTKATVVTMLLLAVLGSVCALSNSTLADFKLFDLNMFDLFDFVSSNILLPVGGIAIALFTGWAWGKHHFIDAISNHGQLQNKALGACAAVPAALCLARADPDRDVERDESLVTQSTRV